ncbi:hypothetical protein PAMA_018379 [Pampus argenteus]
MTRVKAVQAYKDLVYDQRYRDVSVSPALAELSWLEPAATSLPDGGIGAARSAIRAAASRSGTRRRTNNVEQRLCGLRLTGRRLSTSSAQRGIPKKDITHCGHRDQMFSVKVPIACCIFPILWLRQLLWLDISACQHQARDTKKFHYPSSPVCCDREEEITIAYCREARKEGEL